MRNFIFYCETIIPGILPRDKVPFSKLCNAFVHDRCNWTIPQVFTSVSYSKGILEFVFFYLFLLHRRKEIMGKFTVAFISIIAKHKRKNQYKYQYFWNRERPLIGVSWKEKSCVNDKHISPRSTVIRDTGMKVFPRGFSPFHHYFAKTGFCSVKTYLDSLKGI